MEFHFFIDVDRKVIMEAFYGDISISSIEKAIPHIYSHPDYNKLFDCIVDLRRANSQYSRQPLLNFVKNYSDHELIISGRLAVLVSEPTLAAMVTLYADEIKSIHSVGIFCSESEIHYYLQISPDFFSKINDLERISLP